MANPDYDKIVEEMSSLQVDDPEELPLFLEAMEIYLRELPHTPLVQWMHRIAVQHEVLDRLADRRRPLSALAPSGSRRSRWS